MAIGTDLLNSVIGNTETAYLVVEDLRSLCAPKKKDPLSKLFGSVASAVGEVATAAAEAANAATSAVLGGGTSELPVTEGAKKKYFKVQFNPSELTLNGMLERTAKQDAQAGAQQKGKRTTTDAVQRPTITMTVRLYFDDVCQSDAFMGEKFTSGLSVQTAVNAVSMLSGKVYSVQPQVEALIAALRNEYTRTITFYWGKFSFSGQLSNVGAQYTMFSTSGRPVRAVVSLRIYQELDPAKISSWYTDFTNTFKGGGLSLTGAAQKVGNLLNMNL